ncbi:hypothetical protein [Planctomycetes bacterium CA13]|uniref:hypothetical protein n=1 Tax=Novipirellula herctigrandis TaxID=2527986 RepID=UPI0011B501AA
MSRRLGFLALFAVFIVVNAPYQYDTIGLSGGFKDTKFDFPLDQEEGLSTVYPTEAGWPARYYIAHSFDDVATSTSWSWLAMVIDLGVVLLSLGAVVGYSKATRRKVSSLKSSKYSISLSDLLVLVLLVALPMGYWQLQTYRFREETAIQKKLSAVGTVQLQLIVPRLIHSRLPWTLSRYLVRITQVDLTEPNDDAISAVCELPHLRALRIGGGQYDLAPLRRLPSMRYLQDLRIAGRSLDATTVDAISSCDLVRQLNVSQTNCSGPSLKAFSKMPRMTRLMALDTAIPFDAWEESPLRNQLQYLTISRPPTGQSAEVAFRDWPKLVELYFRSLDGYMNWQVFDVTIAGMPELTKIRMDAFQRVDMKLEQLPKMTSLGSDYTNITRRVAEGEKAPVIFWGRHVSLFQVPQLDILWLYPDGFESLSIDQCDSLKTLKSSSQCTNGPLAIGFDHEIDVISRRRVVEAFGSQTEVNSIGLIGFSLDQIDLSPLKQNQQLRELDLRDSIIPKGKLETLSSLPITRVNAIKARTDRSFVSELNRSFPELDRIGIDAETTAIRIEDKPNLRRIQFSHHRESKVNALRLVNLPLLESPMVVNEYGQYCYVKNAPKLKGLALLSPLPKMEIEGVEGLWWFIAGGEGLNDSVVQEVLKAKSLTELTLAYPKAKQDAFAGLTTLQSLESLIVPGARLDPDVIAQWQVPKSLKRLNLNDCGLLAAAVEHVVKQGDWVELSLNHNEISSATIRAFSQSPRLAKIAVAGCQFDDEMIAAFGNIAAVTDLDFSTATIPQGGLAKILSKTNKLATLDLRGANVNSQDLQAVIASYPSLRFKLEPTDATLPILTSLTNSKRLIRPEEELWNRMQANQPILRGYSISGQPIYTDPSKIPSPPQLAPPELSLALFRPETAPSDQSSTFMQMFNGFFVAPSSVAMPAETEVSVDNQTIDATEMETEQ